jgi:hypothetical protein
MLIRIDAERHFKCDLADGPLITHDAAKRDDGHHAHVDAFDRTQFAVPEVKPMANTPLVSTKPNWTMRSMVETPPLLASPFMPSPPLISLGG